MTAALACGGAGEQQTTDTSPAAAPSAAAPAATASAGEALFQQRCITCHMANGEGIPGTYPPLAGSEYAAAANAAVPIRIVLHGIEGPITVKGTTYNSLMPAYGVGVVMTDQEVADLLTYVRSSFGNNASAVTAADVAREREATASHTGAMTVELLRPLMGQ
jgi:mono/diheme cytochrome c family protein